VKVTDQGVAMPDVIADVKLAIKEANISATDEDRDLRVGSVILTLHALAARSAGGGLDFRLPFIGMQVKVGSRVTRSDTHAPPHTRLDGTARTACPAGTGMAGPWLTTP